MEEERNESSAASSSSSSSQTSSPTSTSPKQPMYTCRETFGDSSFSSFDASLNSSTDLDIRDAVDQTHDLRDLFSPSSRIVCSLKELGITTLEELLDEDEEGVVDIAQRVDIDFDEFMTFCYEALKLAHPEVEENRCEEEEPQAAPQKEKKSKGLSSSRRRVWMSLSRSRRRQNAAAPGLVRFAAPLEALRRYSLKKAPAAASSKSTTWSASIRRSIGSIAHKTYTEAHQARQDLQRTVRARAIVDILLVSIEASNVITFDYIVLVLVASSLAALGASLYSSSIRLLFSHTQSAQVLRRTRPSSSSPPCWSHQSWVQSTPLRGES